MPNFVEIGQCHAAAEMSHFSRFLVKCKILLDYRASYES